MITEQDYDLVVLDIRMPELDGIETLGEILKNKKNTPVIIHTAYSHYTSAFLTWAADAYVTKSSDLNALKENVKETLMECAKKKDFPRQVYSDEIGTSQFCSF